MTTLHTFFKFTLLILLLATAVACTAQAATPEPGSVSPTATDMATAVATPLPPTATTVVTATPVVTIAATEILPPPIPSPTPLTLTPAVLFEKPTNTSLPNDPVIQERVLLAQKTLAAQLDIPLAEIEFIAYEPTVWPDGSLGCPAPGKTTPPVEIPGYLIQLTTNGKNYRFHGGAGRRPFLCTTKPLKGNTIGDIIQPPSP